MSNGTGKLTVFFEEPFWVGVFERIENGTLSAAKVTFGSEPKDAEIYAFIINHFADLRFGPAVETVVRETAKNPKRVGRDIKKQLSGGIGTKSQQALKLQQEQNKQTRREESREQKESESRRRYALKQQKKREKHRGR